MNLFPKLRDTEHAAWPCGGTSDVRHRLTTVSGGGVIVISEFTDFAFERMYYPNTKAEQTAISFARGHIRRVERLLENKFYFAPVLGRADH